MDEPDNAIARAIYHDAAAEFARAIVAAEWRGDPGNGWSDAECPFCEAPEGCEHGALCIVHAAKAFLETE